MHLYTLDEVPPLIVRGFRRTKMCVQPSVAWQLSCCCSEGGASASIPVSIQSSTDLRVTHCDDCCDVWCWLCVVFCWAVSCCVVFRLLLTQARLAWPLRMSDSHKPCCHGAHGCHVCPLSPFSLPPTWLSLTVTIAAMCGVGLSLPLRLSDTQIEN